ncbi:MAG: molybdopterin-binding protein, partial [Pseudomonadota bacterium]
ASDSVEAIQTRMEATGDVDVYLPIGGASVGDHDHMRRAFAGAGFEPIFEKVAVRPGKPTWFSQRGNQRVLGLPGNPASAMVCAHLFLSPLLGVDWSGKLLTGQLTKSLPANGPREHFMRARAEMAKTGAIDIDPAPNQDSSLLTPFLSCNALIRRLPNESARDSGDFIQILPIAAIIQ